MGYRTKKNLEELADCYEHNQIWKCDLIDIVEGDPDSSVLALDYYYRFLGAKGCSYIVLLMNYNVNKKIHTIKNKTQIKNYIYMCGDDDSITFYDGVKINVLNELKKINVRLNLKAGKLYRNRSGFLFMYKGKWHALEVDTLLGPSYGYIYGHENREDYSWIFHTLGNLGLIPYGAGSPGGNKNTKESLADIVSIKVGDRFDNFSSGFCSTKEIYDLMNYSELAKIIKGSTIEQAKNVILKRGQQSYEIIVSIQNK